jgi:hypothetical protein
MLNEDDKGRKTRTGESIKSFNVKWDLSVSTVSWISFFTTYILRNFALGLFGDEINCTSMSNGQTLHFFNIFFESPNTTVTILISFHIEGFDAFARSSLSPLVVLVQHDKNASFESERENALVQRGIRAAIVQARGPLVRPYTFTFIAFLHLYI